MKIAYLSPYNPENKHAWSGLAHYMRHSLELAGLEIETIDPGPFPFRLWPARILSTLAHRAGWGRKYIWHYDPQVVRDYSRRIDRLLDRSRADLIFSSGTIPLAQVTSSRPMVFWSDATFTSLLDYYFPRNGISPASLELGLHMEAAAILKSRLGIYSSQWAADSALNDYHAPPDRIVVVPFGANLNREPSEIEVEQWIENRPTDVCRLVFLAVEWERKQGSVALAVAESLNRRGQRCELTVVGCRPPDAAALPKWVKVVGFIDRNIPSTEARLAEILSQAHFLILPSRADCTPLAIAEANAFGVPVLTTRTGGIPSMVRDGVNGWCLPLGSALAASLADHAAALMAEAGHYHAIARSARREYVERLNWKTSGRRIREMLGKI